MVSHTRTVDGTISLPRGGGVSLPSTHIHRGSWWSTKAFSSLHHILFQNPLALDLLAKASRRGLSAGLSRGFLGRILYFNLRDRAARSIVRLDTLTPYWVFIVLATLVVDPSCLRFNNRFTSGSCSTVIFSEHRTVIGHDILPHSQSDASNNKLCQFYIWAI